MMSIDLSFVNTLALTTLFEGAWYAFINGGWLVFLWFALKGVKECWMEHIQHEYEHHRRFTLLAISIPRQNEQSPKAVEQIFAQLHGALSALNLIEKYWQGKTQERFSLEIASTGGFIQFYVRANAIYRDLVESVFYAQYPDVEIVEVPDYTEGFPSRFPNSDWNLWGTEFALAKEEAYPIRTYAQFEHTLSQELKDPIAGLLESMSKISSNEHMWIQYVVTPVGDRWKEHAEHIAAELSGAPIKHKQPWYITALEIPEKVAQFILSLVLPPSEHTESHSPDAAPSLMQYLTPGEKAILEGVQLKMAKIGYEVKIRFVYIARHESYMKARGVTPIVGAFKQFSTQDMNAIKAVSSTKTDIDYFFVKSRVAARQRRIMKAYRARHPEMGGGTGKVFNIEELATLYHFPIITVKAPLIHKTESKQAEPPFTLPVSEGYRLTKKSAASERVEDGHPPRSGGHGKEDYGHTEHAPENLPMH